MKKYTANTIYTMNGPALHDHVVITDDQGEILAIESNDHHDPQDVRYMGAIMCPGFINTHCHLELSHMKGKVPTGTGLIAFITDVVTKREAEAEAIQNAIELAEREMMEGGIVAVGDISNTTDTFAQKEKGNLRYYTFVEYFDLLQEENAENTITQYNAVFNALDLSNKGRKSKVPHAPYSMSQKLFKGIFPTNDVPQTISIHNQEMLPEKRTLLNQVRWNG